MNVERGQVWTGKQKNNRHLTVRVLLVHGSGVSNGNTFVTTENIVTKRRSRMRLFFLREAYSLVTGEVSNPPRRTPVERLAELEELVNEWQSHCDAAAERGTPAPRMHKRYAVKRVREILDS